MQVPYAVAGRTGTHVEVFHAGVQKVDATLLVTAAAPGIFTSSGGTGPALVTNQDGSLNSAANPAEAGSLITLYATGEGQTDSAGVDGKRSTEPYPQPVAPVALRVGGRPAEILFAAEAPGLAGMLQINARVPAIVAAGAVPLSLSIGAATSQDGVTVFIK